MLRWYALLLFVVARYQRPGRHERTTGTAYVFWPATMIARWRLERGDVGILHHGV